jgi:GTP-binding protein Era
MDEPRGKTAHRAGAVALLGPPNAGKSTLLNAILGEKLAIVTAKPQTTRSRILGIHNLEGAQILFYDTPGLHQSARPLNRALNESVAGAAEGCDVGVLLVDLTRGWEQAHRQLTDQLREQGTPFLVVGTKADLPAAKGGSWPPPGAEGAVSVLRLSAQSGRGVKALLDGLVEVLPESPPLYPDDQLTDRPVRWLAAELVREALFEELEQELPYAIAVEVVNFDENRPDLVRIRANLLVERNSQKRIVVGSGGQVIKRIGVRSRREIETLLGTRVHLDLWVKIEPRWVKNPKRIKALGYV